MATPGPPLPLFSQQQDDEYGGLLAPAFASLATYMAASNGSVSNQADGFNGGQDLMGVSLSLEAPLTIDHYHQYMQDDWLILTSHVELWRKLAP
jgi:hypothetical protein